MRLTTGYLKVIALNWGFDFFYRRRHSRGGALFILEFSQDGRGTCFRCGTFASGYFIASDGNIISCSNDTGSSNLLGNIAISNYVSVVKNKSVIILGRTGFDICRKCTDDYRWYTLWNGSHEKSTVLRDYQKKDDVN